VSVEIRVSIERQRHASPIGRGGEQRRSIPIGDHEGVVEIEDDGR
jgi:hypothetical protein